MKTINPKISPTTSEPLHVPVSRRELAIHYFPAPNAESSVRRLSRWLHDDQELRHALEIAGYYPRQHVFTRRQLEIFQYYLGL